MHVLLMILGALLMLFGGGCTLVFLATVYNGVEVLVEEPGLMLGVWLPFGVLPLVAGWFMLRKGWRIDREKRKAKAEPEAKP